MCPTCNNLKIKEISIELNNGESVKLNSDDYDIGFYMSKYKMGGDDLSKLPWTLKYEIILNGKFDRDKVNKYDFGSKEMFDELNCQKNSRGYKESCNKLKDIFWDDHKMLNIKYENMVEFTLSNGNIYKILAIVDSDNYPNIPKIKFSRDENNPIK
jgi:hypothetical protein